MSQVEDNAQKNQNNCKGRDIRGHCVSASCQGSCPWSKAHGADIAEGSWQCSGALTLFPLFPCSLHANRRGNIVIYFSSHMEQTQKMGKFTKNFGSSSTTQLLRSGQYRWRSKSPWIFFFFFWWFSKIRFSCLERSAVWECLGHFAHPQLLLLHGRDDMLLLNVMLWCSDSELWAPSTAMDKDKLIALWAWGWLEPGSFLWDADVPPLGNSQDSGFLVDHLCCTLGFHRLKICYYFYVKLGYHTGVSSSRWKKQHHSQNKNTAWEQWGWHFLTISCVGISIYFTGLQNSCPCLSLIAQQ